METRQITRGAMVCAIYAILLLVNQQTALTVELSAPWIFSFPILIYTAMTGTSICLIVAFSMVLITFLFGSFTTWFYSWMSILIGLVYGFGVFHKWKHMTNFLLAFLFSLIGNALIIYLWAGLFGYDLHRDMEWIMGMFPWIRLQTLFILYVFVAAMLHALPIHIIALRICMSMKIELRPMQSPVQMESPRWFGIVSLVIWGLFFFSQSMVNLNEGAQVVIQVLMLLDLLVLDYLGVIYFLSLCLIHKQRKGIPFSIIGAWIP
ncbi:MAG: hypothetical protein J6D18_03745, partial [Erysipelotrichaceae bacterium]|nr:hypothetical protein [Erysipelotrichaceae bacterium]